MQRLSMQRETALIHEHSMKGQASAKLAKLIKHNQDKGYDLPEGIEVLGGGDGGHDLEAFAFEAVCPPYRGEPRVRGKSDVVPSRLCFPHYNGPRREEQ